MKTIKRLLFGLMFTLNIALFLALTYLFVGRGYFVVAGFSSIEVVTVVLAALGVLLTALGIFIALLAIWGYQTLRGMAGEVASDEARKTAQNVVKSELPAMVSRELAEQIALGSILGPVSPPTAEGQEALNSLDGDVKK